LKGTYIGNSSFSVVFLAPAVPATLLLRVPHKRKSPKQTQGDESEMDHVEPTDSDAMAQMIQHLMAQLKTAKIQIKDQTKQKKLLVLNQKLGIYKLLLASC
jgi:hypothetical protein